MPSNLTKYPAPHTLLIFIILNQCSELYTLGMSSLCDVFACLFISPGYDTDISWQALFQTYVIYVPIFHISI
jgi:hypothetical protein